MSWGSKSGGNRRSLDPLAEAARAASAGDARAIDKLVLASGPSVLHVVRKIMGRCHPDVEDVAQDAIFAALDALPGFRGESTVLHFVWRVAALTAINARRRVQLRELIPSECIDLDELPGNVPSPISNVVATRQRCAFRQLLDELPPVQAEVVALHCVVGLTIEETAAATGAPPNTVRSRLMTARSVLRKRLAAYSELFELVKGA
jgi:RNA polymerase sigma-70 factor (ECF subfamily)